MELKEIKKAHQKKVMDDSLSGSFIEISIFFKKFIISGTDELISKGEKEKS